jgi:hypothetical protein
MITSVHGRRFVRSIWTVMLVKEMLLRGQKFADDNEVMQTVQSWLKAMPKSFFLEGIHKLVDRWTKCVAKQGDYVEK